MTIKNKSQPNNAPLTTFTSTSTSTFAKPPAAATNDTEPVAAPAATNAEPAATNAEPNVAGPKPDVAGPKPDVAETKPNVAGPKPDVAGPIAEPNVAETKTNDTEPVAEPNVAETNVAAPAATNAAPDVAGTNVAEPMTEPVTEPVAATNAETKPDVAGTKPDVAETKTNVAEPVAAPIAEPDVAATKTNDTEPVAAPIAEPDVAEPVAAPMAEPNVAATNVAATKPNVAETKTNDTEPDCTIVPSLFGGADPECNVEQQMPEVQEAIKEAFYETISRWGSKFSMTALKNILIATGNEALWNAILDGSMTPQQALLFKKVIKDPQVAEAVEEVKETAMEGINASIASLQADVLPTVKEAAGEFATGIGTSVITAASDIPPVGAVISGISAVGTLVDAAENATEITEGFKTAIEPITTAVGKIDKINNAVTDAVARAESEMPGTKTEEPMPGAKPEEQVPGAVVEKNPAPVPTTAAATAATAAAAGGGSRKRRHIHKLSRRIERTLRRVQKKYGLQDKNSFLRRTLHSRKK